MFIHWRGCKTKDCAECEPVRFISGREACGLPRLPETPKHWHQIVGQNGRNHFIHVLKYSMQPNPDQSSISSVPLGEQFNLLDKATIDEYSIFCEAKTRDDYYSSFAHQVYLNRKKTVENRIQAGSKEENMIPQNASGTLVIDSKESDFQELSC